MRSLGINMVGGVESCGFDPAARLGLVTFSRRGLASCLDLS